jgi:ribonuclease BN (tRNA processing enzyme)
VELIVLGSSGSWPGPRAATSGYLLRHEGFNLWVDLGTGTFANLQKYVGLLDLDGVVVSHAHPDHFVDLYALFYARLFHQDPLPPLPLFCPPGCFGLVASVASSGRVREMAQVFDVREIEPGMSFEAGPLRVETREMRHSVATLGLRIKAGNTVFAYTADTGPTEEVVTLARGAELLLAEATYQTSDTRAPLHLTARQAGELAARANVGQLVLTHLWPDVDPEVSRAQAEEAFGAEVAIAAVDLHLSAPARNGPSSDKRA